MFSHGLGMVWGVIVAKCWNFIRSKPFHEDKKKGFGPGRPLRLRRNPQKETQPFCVHFATD